MQNLVDYLWQLVVAVYLNDLRLEHKLGMLVAFPIFLPSYVLFMVFN